MFGRKSDPARVSGVPSVKRIKTRHVLGLRMGVNLTLLSGPIYVRTRGLWPGQAAPPRVDATSADNSARCIPVVVEARESRDFQIAEKSGPNCQGWSGGPAASTLGGAGWAAALARMRRRAWPRDRPCQSARRRTCSSHPRPSPRGPGLHS